MVCLFTPIRFGIECLSGLSLRGAERRRNLKSKGNEFLILFSRKDAEGAEGFC